MFKSEEEKEEEAAKIHVSAHIWLFINLFITEIVHKVH